MPPVKKSARRAARRGKLRVTDEPPRYSYATVHKDPLDLRDLTYEGSLDALPRRLDNRPNVPRPMLNQKTEGACTGFGLAAVVNYLIANHPEARDWKEGRRSWQVSPRMLYEMAKRYDEWPGEDYEGSSIRAAMKGWHRHGVCTEALWKYRPGVSERPTPERLADARKRPLGNYFRVRHLHLSHMHAALREVGILCASARVHEGWIKPAGGRITFSAKSIGGHAFAIVGYDEHGFWIQNSWGPTWGRNGFAHLTYDDWLENGWDCWVARLGVPIERRDQSVVELGGRSITLGRPPAEAEMLHDIRPHFVNLGNDGRLSASGRYSTTPDDLRDIFEGDQERRATSRGHLAEEISGWRQPKILLYAHGGLNSESDSVISIKRRSNSLHVPMASDLSGRFVVMANVFSWLLLSVLYTLIWFRGIAFGQSNFMDLFVLLVLFPLALWTVAAVSVVIRLLGYLDTRIRLEGWEVELAIRAEAMRQFGEDAGPTSPRQPQSGRGTSKNQPRSEPILDAIEVVTPAEANS